VEDALRFIQTEAPIDWFGEEGRGLKAARVGEIRLLAGDSTGAERSLAMARRYIRSASRHYADVARLEALLAVETGDMVRARIVLMVAATKRNGAEIYSDDNDRCCLELGDTRSPQHQWSEFRYYADAQLVRYLFWRGRTEEAVSICAELDTMRRLALLDFGYATAQSDEARAASDGHLGLGLFLVQSHARSLGGCCQVQSTIGRGTSFSVKIPLLNRPLGPSCATKIEDMGERAEIIEGTQVVLES